MSKRRVNLLKSEGGVVGWHASLELQDPRESTSVSPFTHQSLDVWYVTGGSPCSQFAWSAGLVSGVNSGNRGGLSARDAWYWKLHHPQTLCPNGGKQIIYIVIQFYIQVRFIIALFNFLDNFLQFQVRLGQYRLVMLGYVTVGQVRQARLGRLG